MLIPTRFAVTSIAASVIAAGVATATLHFVRPDIDLSAVLGTIVAVLIIVCSAVTVSAYALSKQIRRLVEALQNDGPGAFTHTLSIPAYDEHNNLIESIDIGTDNATGSELALLVESIKLVSKQLEQRELTIRQVIEESMHHEMNYQLEKQKLEIEQHEHKKTDQLRLRLEQSLEELEHAQRQLMMSEKMAMLGSLVAGIAHEVNTPLGIAVTSASYLSENVRSFRTYLESGQLKKSELNTFIKAMEDSNTLLKTNLERAANTIHGFKQVSVDQTSDSSRVFNVRNYIGEIIRSLHPRLKQTSIDFHIECDSKVQIHSYPGVLAQVLTNMIMNSVVHGFPQGNKGSVTISFTQDAQNTCHLVYSDSGAGVSDENLQHLFEPFRTSMRNQGGSGLGTYIIYSLISQKLNGSITAESPPDTGLTYRVSFPSLESAV